MSTISGISKPSKNISMPRVFLHLEGLALLTLSIYIYAWLGYGWGIFILLLFSPDLPMLIYLADKRIGSVAYNLVHTITFPILLALVSYISDNSFGIQLSLIWLAHIGMDHVFGYGFKYLGHMKETHFSRV